MKSSFFKYSWYAVLGALLWVPVFGHMDTFPLRIWDEARLAMNAYEMMNNGDVLITYCDGEPDMWNTKPPLMIWFQVICMKIVGVNEVAVRLPSAIAAFFTIVCLVRFSVKYLKDFWFGFIASMVLITATGYISFHGTRTGDYDSLLCLFTTASLLFIFAWRKTDRVKFLYLFFICLSMGVLTKGVAGLLFLPGIGIYLLTQKRVLPLLKNKHFYLGILVFIIPVLGFYISRELMNPGYLRAVAANEWGGRYLDTIEEHQHGFWFYYNNFIRERIKYWMLFIPLGILLGLLSRNEKLKQLTLFILIVSLSYFIIISCAGTKLFWYDLPLYPMLALFIAIFIHTIFNYLKQLPFASENFTANALPCIFLFLLFYTPYQNTLKRIYTREYASNEKRFYEISEYLRDASKGRYDLNGQFIVYPEYKAHLQFYQQKIKRKNVQVDFKNWDQLEANDEVIISQDYMLEKVKAKYLCEEIARRDSVFTFKILGEK